MAVDGVELVLCHFVSAESERQIPDSKFRNVASSGGNLPPGSRSEKLISNLVSIIETNQTTDLVLVTKPSRD